MSDLAELCRQALQVGVGLWVQSVFLVSIGLVLGRLMRGRGPLYEAAAYKSTLCAVVLSACLGVAFAGHIRPIWRVDLPLQLFAQAAPPSGVVAQSPKAVILTEASRSSGSQVSIPMTPPKALRAMAPSNPTWSLPAMYLGAAAIWAVVSLLQIAWLLPGALTLLRIARMPQLQIEARASQILTEMSQRAQVATPRLIPNDEIRSPFAAGLFRPMIVVPRGMLGMDETVLGAVLAHELGHVAGGDCAWAPVYSIVMALAWPQPLLRLLYLRWLAVSEYVCDAWALGNGCSPHAYAECLVRLSEERQAGGSVHGLALGMVPFPSLLGQRVQQILTWGGGKLTSLSRSVRLVVACTTVVVGCAAVLLIPGSLGARATNQTVPGHPKQPFSSLTHGVAPVKLRVIPVTATNQGASMDKIAARTLATVAAVAGGLVQVNLPPVADAAPVPHKGHAASSVQKKTLPASDATVTVARSAYGPLISLTCNNVPIRSALEKVFQADGAGYSLASDVTGNVTVHVVSLPLSALLSVLLRSSDQPLMYDVADNVYTVKSRHLVQNAVSSLPAVSSPVSAASVDPAYAAQSHTYKVFVNNVLAGDLADRLNDDDIRQASNFPPQVRVIVIKADNALLISATPDDYQRVCKVIRSLDVLPAEAEIRVWLIDVEPSDLQKLGLSLDSIGGNPRSSANLALVGALQQGKLGTALETPEMTITNGVRGSVTLTCDLPSGLERLVLSMIPTILPDGTVTTHLTWQDDLSHTSFDYTTTAYSGETVLVGANPEVGSKYQLVFVQPTIMPIAGGQNSANPVGPQSDAVPIGN